MASYHRPGLALQEGTFRLLVTRGMGNLLALTVGMSGYGQRKMERHTDADVRLSPGFSEDDRLVCVVYRLHNPLYSSNSPPIKEYSLARTTAK